MWERVHISDDMTRSCSSCDCITYSYFLISVFLFTLGTVISVFSLGAFDDTVFSNLGHMWMVGPLCICSAIMIGIRNVLYLRRRRVIDMVIRQQISVTQLVFFLNSVCTFYFIQHNVFDCRTSELNKLTWQTLSNSIHCRYAQWANLLYLHLMNSW